MTTRQTGAILRHIRNLIDGETTKNLSDAELLQRFAAQGEEAAFTALVQRHGALVWGVCQHLLHHEQDAEDAFQATFLVLARRAASIRKTEAVGSFLHGVAYRIAVRTKQRARRRQVSERQAVGPSSSHPPDDSAWRELQTILDEEVARLPEKYRSPFVLCCLEGTSREEAARALRCNPGTISSRIARARQLLQQRLSKRGVTLSATLCAVVLWKQTSAATVPTLLASRTVQAVVGSAEGFSATAIILAEGALRALGLSRWHLGGLLILGVSLLAAGAGVSRFVAVEPPEPAPKEAPATPAEARNDLHGDPLPPGAIARLGTVRQRAPESRLAVTADGKEIIALGGGLTVRRFDARTGALHSIRQLPRASGEFRYGTWLSPRGTFALAAGSKGPDKYVLDLWDLAKGKIQRTLSLSFPQGAAFSKDERRIAVADCTEGRQTLRVLIWDWRTSTSRVLWSERRNIHQFYFEPFVIFAPDGKRLISCHFDQILRCWDMETEKLLWQSEKKIYSPLLVFSHDGKTLISPSGIGTNDIEIRDTVTGKLLKTKKLLKEGLQPIGYSPDGRFLAFQTGKEEVVLWEMEKEKIAFRFPRPPYRRDDPIYFGLSYLPANFAFTPDSKGFIRRAGALQRWDLTAGKPLYTDTENWGHTEDVTRLLFSPNGRLLASSSKDQTVRLWDVATTRAVHTFAKDQSDHLAFTPDGRFLLAVPYFVLRGTILQARDVTTGRPGRSFGFADRRDFSTGVSGKELRFTADGKKILMLNFTGKTSDLMVWNAESGECLLSKSIPFPLGRESLLTPDGQSVLAFDSATQSVRLLALEAAKPRWQLKPEPMHKGGNYYDCNFALSPDGRMMAARLGFVNVTDFRNEHEPIHLADMATGRQLSKLSTDSPAVFAFSMDNRLFAVAGPAGIRLWETTTWQTIGSIPIPNREARPQDRACASSLAFSPDGRNLATGHADGTILLWDATLRGSGRRGQLSAAQRQALWTDLAGTDAAKAYAAVGRLADDPASSVSFLKEKLKPIAPVPAERLRSLLEELDSDQFAVREMAARKLRALGERVASSLRTELKAKPSLEKRKRIEGLLAALNESAPLSGESVRALRAVQVLERIGSAEARPLLERLSRGVESARLTRAATEALARLKKR